MVSLVLWDASLQEQECIGLARSERDVAGVGGGGGRTGNGLHRIILGELYWASSGVRSARKAGLWWSRSGEPF